MFCAIFNFQTRSRVHAAFRHVVTKGVPAYMGRDLWHLHFIDTVVLLANVLKVFLPMQGYHRHIIFVQIKESAFAVNHRLFFTFFLFAIIRWKHAYTSSDIGISLVPLVVLVSSILSPSMKCHPVCPVASTTNAWVNKLWTCLFSGKIKEKGRCLWKNY